MVSFDAFACSPLEFLNQSEVEGGIAFWLMSLSSRRFSRGTSSPGISSSAEVTESHYSNRL